MPFHGHKKLLPEALSISQHRASNTSVNSYTSHTNVAACTEPSTKMHIQNFKVTLKLFLSYASAHDARRRGARRNDIAHLIYNLGATPFLMCQCLYAMLPLFPLDKLHVGTH